LRAGLQWRAVVSITATHHNATEAPSRVAALSTNLAGKMQQYIAREALARAMRVR
jgi:hypothetical protein